MTLYTSLASLRCCCDVDRLDFPVGRSSGGVLSRVLAGRGASPSNKVNGRVQRDAPRAVLGLRLSTDFAFFDSRNDDALRNVRHIYRRADTALEDGEVGGREFAHSEPVRFERIRQRPHNRYRCGRANGFWLVYDSIPDGTLNGQSLSGQVAPSHAANFALSQSGERRKQNNRLSRFGEQLPAWPESRRGL